MTVTVVGPSGGGVAGAGAVGAADMGVLSPGPRRLIPGGGTGAPRPVVRGPGADLAAKRLRGRAHAGYGQADTLSSAREAAGAACRRTDGQTVRPRRLEGECGLRGLADLDGDAEVLVAAVADGGDVAQAGAAALVIAVGGVAGHGGARLAPLPRAL